MMNSPPFRTGTLLFVVAFAHLSVMACASVPVAAQTGVSSPDTSVRVLLNADQGIQRPLRSMVTTREEWERLWHEVHRLGASVPPLPVVDFAREMIIVAAMGIQYSAGGRIAIVRVRDISNTLEATIELHPPCDGFAAISYPTAIVAVPLKRVTPVFQDRWIPPRC